jgi:G3E family GTPase
MIPTTLVMGKTAFDREQAIATELEANATLNPPLLKSAVLLEGFSDGKTTLVADDKLTVVRISSGCVCCSNNMIMGTYLNRLIQQKPQQLFLSLSTASHLEQIKQFLAAGSYANILKLSKVIDLTSIMT